jgi:hypothetical protein
MLLDFTKSFDIRQAKIELITPEIRDKNFNPTVFFV